MSQPPYPPPPYYGPPQPQKSSAGTWIIIVVVALFAIVAVIGILAVFAVAGTRKYIANAKTAEARNTLGQLAKDAVSAYERDGKLCPSASAPVPTVVPSGSKYMSTPADWDADKTANAGFACLGFSMSMPQYYQYDYKATATGFTVTARRDLA